MLSLRYFFRLISAFFLRFKAIIFLGTTLGIVSFLFLFFFVPILFSTHIERIGVVGRYSATSLPDFVLKEIGTGLTKLDATGTAIPSLAESWSTPDNGKTWIFKLSDKFLWQDGKKVTSSSINYEFSDVTVERSDDRTLIFRLQNPYSAFPTVLSKPAFKKGLLGTGEYTVKRLTLSGGYVESLTIKNTSKDVKIYKFYSTEETAKIAFKLGSVDTLLGIITPTPLNGWKHIKLQPNVESGEFVAVFLNTKSSILSDKSTRQALAYAIDKKALGGERALSPVSKDSWAYNPQVKPYDFDLEKARTTLSTLAKDSKSELKISLTTSPILLPQAEKIAKDWEAAGVKTNLQVSSFIPQDYEALLVIFEIPKDPDQYSIWHSTQTSSNISKYQNPRIDLLLEDGRAEIGTEERRKTYLDFQRFLVEDSPVIFLYYPTTYTISR